MKSRFKTDVFILKTPIETINADGSRSKTYTEATYTGSIQGRTGDKSVNNETDRVKAGLRLYTDIITVNYENVVNYGGEDYKIIFINNRFNHHLEIDLEFKK